MYPSIVGCGFSGAFAGTSAFFSGLYLAIGFGFALLAIGLLVLTLSISSISDRTLVGAMAGMLIVSGVLVLLIMLVFAPSDRCELIREGYDNEGNYKQRYQAQNCQAIEDFVYTFKPGIWLVAPSIGAGIGAIALNVFKKRSSH